MVETGSLSPLAFASTTVGPGSPQSTCLLGSGPPSVMSLLPTRLTHTQVALGAQQFPRFTQPRGDFGTKVWTHFSPVSPGILQVLYKCAVH